MSNWIVYSLIVILSFFLTEICRRYSLKNNFLDIPNVRSSHICPTPRGGGISIACLFLVIVAISNLISHDVTLAFMGAGFLVALVGFLDDKAHIAARWRLLFHFVAALWALYYLGEIPEFQLLNYTFSLGWFGIAIAAILLVWMLNLFNFMDGIDGIAAAEAIFVACGSAFFSYLNGLEGLLFISLVLASSTMGFLLLNWFPAKIFLGDVGSGFLGLMLGMIAYANIVEGGSIWIWVTLLGVFLVDSGITLLRRILRGDNWYEAHCNHAYQHAARKWGHKRVTVATILINLCWLFPMAYLVCLDKNNAVLLTLIAYTPLIIMVLKFKAGMDAGK